MNLATLGGALRRNDAARALKAKGMHRGRGPGGGRAGEQRIGKLAGRVRGASLLRG